MRWLRHALTEGINLQPAPQHGRLCVPRLTRCGVHLRPVVQGVQVFRMKERQIITAANMRCRKAWAERRKGRSKMQRAKKPRAIIDNKHWQLFTTRGGRAHAARRQLRGAYQQRGQPPEALMVKSKGGNMRFPAKGVVVSAAAIKGRIRMWHYIDGPWYGQAAADMCKGPLARALTRAYPEHAEKPGSALEVLEDNDPTGYKSSKALAAKAEAGIRTDDLPKRSPDLSVLDYSLWRAISRAMRAQERTWPSDRRGVRRGVQGPSPQDGNGLARITCDAMRGGHDPAVPSDLQPRRQALHRARKCRAAIHCFSSIPVAWGAWRVSRGLAARAPRACVADPLAAAGNAN